MMNDMECPYCGAGVTIEHSDYDIEDGSSHETECRECGKAFVFTVRISVNYTPQKADCLNGSPHNYRFSICAPAEYSTMQCTMCGDRRALTEDERKELI